MAASGCKGVEFGTDAGGATMIANWRRGVGCRRTCAGQPLCHHTDQIRPQLDLRRPGETSRPSGHDALMEERKPTAVIAFVGIRFLPGTVWSRCPRDGQIDPDDNLLHPVSTSPIRSAISSSTPSKATPARTRMDRARKGIRTNVQVLQRLRDGRSRGTLATPAVEVRALVRLVRAPASPPAGRRRSDARPAGLAKVTASRRRRRCGVTCPGKASPRRRGEWPPSPIPRPVVAVSVSSERTLPGAACRELGDGASVDGSSAQPPNDDAERSASRAPAAGRSPRSRAPASDSAPRAVAARAASGRLVDGIVVSELRQGADHRGLLRGARRSQAAAADAFIDPKKGTSPTTPRRPC